jgi:hypothetical protein
MATERILLDSRTARKHMNTETKRQKKNNKTKRQTVEKTEKNARKFFGGSEDRNTNLWGKKFQRKKQCPGERLEAGTVIHNTNAMFWY